MIRDVVPRLIGGIGRCWFADCSTGRFGATFDGNIGDTDCHFCRVSIGASLPMGSHRGVGRHANVIFVGQRVAGIGCRIAMINGVTDNAWA